MENTLLNTYLQEEVREGFKIDNLEEATWAFKKLRAIEHKEADIKATAEKEIAGIESWRDKELKQYEADKQYFKFLLEEHYKNEKAKDKKFKLSTPYGKVTSSTKDKYFYDDEQAIMDYCNMNEIDVIRVKEELDKAAFKKVCKGGVNHETGEVIPGVRVEKTESITVKVEEPLWA